MTQSYADLCIERASKATEGPWKYIDREGDYPSSWISASKTTGYDEEDEPHTEVCKLPSSAYGYECNFDNNGPFIAHAREDVPKLANIVKDLEKENVELKNKLKKACEVIRDASVMLRNDKFIQIADELEAMPENSNP
jgi:hypothetical protein